jgi:hypothetical protein
MRSILAILTIAALSGCSSTSYFLVSSQFVASTQSQQPAEIIATDAYRGDGSKTKTVALRAPDSCANATAAQATGDAASRGTILMTHCGVEMAEIEKALARNNYRVISWNVLAREMRGTKSANEVAESLGADVLFQINSLEKSQKTLGKDARWERKYFRSNHTAQEVAPLPLADDDRALIRQRYLNDVDAKYNDKSRTYAVTLDATAVWVKSGQSIWYYRWTRGAESDPTGTRYSVLLACEDGHLPLCHRTFPTQNAVARSTLMTAGESTAVSISEKAEDREKALYAELLREVIDNFVGSYAESRRSTGSAAPAAAAPAPTTEATTRPVTSSPSVAPVDLPQGQKS